MQILCHPRLALGASRKAYCNEPINFLVRTRNHRGLDVCRKLRTKKNPALEPGFPLDFAF